MCLWVEKAHVKQLINSVEATLERLRKAAPQRAHDLLFDLPAAVVEPAIIFRDFPKAHGNIIQKAVGIALQHHPGGYEQTSLSFSFLSGLKVEIDNFFMASDGQIYLFETKRDQGNIREEGVAGRNLWDVKNLIEAEVLDRTGRPLRRPVKLAYFSYADESFGGAPKPNQANIASKAQPSLVDLPIYSREDMNRLIGPCFGRFLQVVDRAIDLAISKAVPEMTNKRRLGETAQVQSDLAELMHDGAGLLNIGDPPETRSLTDDDVLSSATQVRPRTD
ncbi:hypothetical protein MA20_17885 [Bradyrhizobium japonicum]|uniref:Restriction endonuclease n=1 Tax=Bradyrhizobium japonicum TaxID=375 RepID=A0A0A3Y0V8_BRAJP|nr:hypothetical protein [Bradyrhizobium japonicum]KGT79199.1 hypothetical protein MA20_17885 [Bradyrhizobium japonicum]